MRKPQVDQNGIVDGLWNVRTDWQPITKEEILAELDPAERAEFEAVHGKIEGESIE